MLVKLWNDRIYFGDWKPPNLLVSFQGKRFILGDFGCAMQINRGDNFVKGGTQGFSLDSVLEKCLGGSPVSVKELKDNEVHAFYKSFEHQINVIENIQADFDKKEKEEIK